jgi:hypothetical protein
MSDTERGWVRQTFRGEQVPDLYHRSDAPDADFEEADPAPGAARSKNMEAPGSNETGAIAAQRSASKIIRVLF